MITEELKQAVMAEAFRFVTNASQEQKDNLDFEKLNPLSPEMCVYGQSSSDHNCFGDEAMDLFAKCAVPYSHSAFGSGEAYSTEGELDEKCFDDGLAVRTAYSAVEHYITQEGANNESLFKFMKGETKTLKL